MKKKERLDKLLLQRRLVETREEGRRRILAGEIWVSGDPVSKVGTRVDVDADVEIRGRSGPFVSRGGQKLEKALRDFRISVRGRLAMDVGASTGGFTDCLLRYGARSVYAVDVGYGQLDWKLRTDPRVVVLEKKNIRYLKPEDIPESPDIATVDVAFISLRLVLLPIKEILSPEGEIIALIKPQFEVGRGKVGKGGVVRSPEEHARVIGEISKFAEKSGFKVKGVTESPLLGPKGNREFFIHLALNHQNVPGRNG